MQKACSLCLRPAKNKYTFYFTSASTCHCGPGLYRCSDGETCFSPAKVCDGSPDCPSGEDETNCCMYENNNVALLMCVRVCVGVCLSFLCLFGEFRCLFLLIYVYRHQSLKVYVRYAMHVSFWIRVHVFQLLYACVARAGTCVRTRTFALIVQKSAMEVKTAQTAMTKLTAVSLFVVLLFVRKFQHR